jgi:hypothetical protein
MGKLDTVNLKGKSGNSYEFEIYPIDQPFNPVGAVYAIFKYEPRPGTATAWYRHIYVGETGDLSTRFSSHHKQNCFDEHGADRIGVHVDSSEKSRKSKEADIRNAGHWPCND